jgi:hypothetical protein
MRTRNRIASVIVMSALGAIAFIALRGDRPAPPSASAAAPAVTGESVAQTAPPRAPLPAAAVAALAAGDPTPPPAPSGKLRLAVADREQYEEVSDVIEYFRQKPLPKHGPVRSVGDGVDSSDRNAKLPPDTSFARFRYEYEKHDSDRLMEDLTWADHELARLKYDPKKGNESLSPEDRSAGELLARRRQAIVSILGQRAREEELHDRYNRVEVIYQDPNAPAPSGGG